MSKKYELSFEDWKRVIRNIAIIYAPVVFMFFDQIQAGTFEWSILGALAISISIDTLRRYFTDYTNQ